MKKIISIKTQYDNYRDFEKEFKSEAHLSNWQLWYNRTSQNKIIGIKTAAQ